ncbi:MAG: hypothetical protein AAF823_09410 [Planctomycetota bacterium]
MHRATSPFSLAKAALSALVLAALTPNFAYASDAPARDTDQAPKQNIAHENQGSPNQAQPFINVGLTQLANLLRGPDGRIRMPIDVYDPDRNYKALTRSHLKVKAPAKRSIQREAAGEPTLFRVSLGGFNHSTEAQLKDTWCWAAAIRSSERYMFPEHADSYDQESVVRRIHKQPLDDETAVSFQVVQALAFEPGVTQPEQVEYVATLGAALEILGPGSEVNALDLAAEFLNQRVGTKEAVESIGRGEPVLVCFREEGFRHIYVLNAIDFIRIEMITSDEFKLRAVQAVLNRDVKQLKLKKNTGLLDLNNLPRIKLPNLFNRNYYAGVTFHMFDPLGGTQGRPEFVSIDGAEFKDRLFFMINRTKALDIIEEAMKKSQEAISNTGLPSS